MLLDISKQRFLASAVNIVVCKSEKDMKAICAKHNIPCRAEDATGVIIKPRQDMYVMFVMASAGAELKHSLGDFRHVNISFSGVKKQDASNWYFVLNRHLYIFNKYRGSEKKKEWHISLYHPCAREWVTENTFINQVRDIENEPNNVLYPETFCELAKTLLAPYSDTVKVRVMDHEEIIKEGLLLIDAVGKGSHHGPRFMIIEYNGKPSTMDGVAVICKTVTHDSGGYNLKPSRAMVNMHHDKCGGSVGLGTIMYLAEMKIPINVIGLLPIADNAISGAATKPHDIVKSYSGKTVEINDTDAEGRLIMADALAYLKNFKHVKWVIDIATLTGMPTRMFSSLGAAYYHRNIKNHAWLTQLGEKIEEKLWPYPYWDNDKKGIQSQIADISNVSLAPSADAYNACQFLLEFVPPKLRDKFIHIDIGKNEHGTLALGTGTRLLIHLLPRLFKR